MPLHLEPENPELEHEVFRRSRQVADSLECCSLRPFTEDQKFIIQLTCESYDEKLNHKDDEIHRLLSDLLTSREENSMLKIQLKVQRETIRILTAKLKNSKDMNRILMKYSEIENCQENNYLTTAMIDNLVNSKINEIKELSAGDLKNKFKLVKPDEFLRKRSRSCIEDSHL